MNKLNSDHIKLAENISEHFSSIPQVNAVALGGSSAKGFTDRFSDIDLYVYSGETVPLKPRQNIVKEFGVKKADLNLTFWDLGDQWIDPDTEIEVDIIYWDKNWIQGQIDRVLVNHEASVGYSTCFWHTVLNSTLLFDRNGWFKDLQAKCRQPYPEKLRNAVIAKNYPVLKNVIPSYFNQIKKAIKRSDLISINHRVAALLASYFDILFAVNYLPNPGEKKLIKFALEFCKWKPKNLEIHIYNILEAAGNNLDLLPEQITELLDNMDKLLVDKGIDPLNTITLDDTEEN
ncbi:MAG: DUF4037 domain-containing protein [Spirochaetales bacterium]|nr:DUF4037 domain-containing protein [Spirochaetales bacterium]